ncbi:hypothetical protein M8C21_024560, partial [Ambrosia artemisiifolia]
VRHSTKLPETQPPLSTQYKPPEQTNIPEPEKKQEQQPPLSDQHTPPKQTKIPKPEKKQEQELVEPKKMKPATNFVLQRKTGNLEDFFTLGEKLGQGQFGTVFLCIDKGNGERYACKSIVKSKLLTDNEVEDVRREIQIMHLLVDHPNVISIKGEYEDDVAIHIVMELCTGGELFDRIITHGCYTERKAAELTRAIVGVVEAFSLRVKTMVETQEGIFEQVLHGDLDLSSDPWPSISDGAKDLLRRMLDRDPKRRLTAHKVDVDGNRTIDGGEFVVETSHINETEKENHLFGEVVAETLHINETEKENHLFLACSYFGKPMTMYHMMVLHVHNTFLYHQDIEHSAWGTLGYPIQFVKILKSKHLTWKLNPSFFFNPTRSQNISEFGSGRVKMGNTCAGPNFAKNGIFQSVTAAIWTSRSPDEEVKEQQPPLSVQHTPPEIMNIPKAEKKQEKEAVKPKKMKLVTGAAGLRTESVLQRKTGNLKHFYTLGKKLGQGQFGTTFLCIDKGSGELYACKSIAKRKLLTDEDVEDVRREIQIMHHLAEHPNVISIKGAYEDAVAVHLVMELCAGGELFDRIVARGHYSERKAAELTRTIVGVIAESLSEEEIAGLKQMFQMIDTDNSGHITFDELKDGLKRVGANLKESEIYDLMQAVSLKFMPIGVIYTYEVDELDQERRPHWVKITSDATTSDATDVTHWVIHFQILTLIVKLAKMLTQADVDDSGTIDYGEFVAATLHMNKIEKENHLFVAFSYFDKDGSGYITADELQHACEEFGIDVPFEELIQDVDQDNDGRIDYNEFVAMMQGPANVDAKKNLEANFSLKLRGALKH